MPSSDPVSAIRAHLALTGLRGFWPTDKPVWLVSPSCIPFPPLELDDPLIAGVMPHPWVPGDLPGIQAEARSMYEHILVFLTERLNALHGVDHSYAYWRVLIGPWLFYYINLVCYHYTTLGNARSRLGTFESIGLDQGSYVTPSNTLEFLHEATDDPYNLQLYTRLCQAMGIPIIEYRSLLGVKRLAHRENPENLPQRKPPLARRVANRMLGISRKWGQRFIGFRAQIVFRRSFLPSQFEWKLVAALRGRVWPHYGEMYLPPSSGTTDPDMRDTFRGFISGGGDLESFIGGFLSSDIPRVFVEEYADLVSFAEQTYPYSSPGIVLSTAAWDTDEAFCHFAGKQAEAGAQLVGGECSAIFGIEKDSHILKFERSQVNRYLTWGWSDPDDPGCIPTPANRVIGMRERRPPLKGDGILYVGTVALRFPVVIRPDFSGYPDLQRRFFESVDPELLPQFRVRLHITDYGWGIERRLKAAFPDLTIDRWEQPFPVALSSARLCVCDHLSTTWTISLASNTPTVIFWDPVFTPIRAEMQPVFERGREAGFLQDTPESAAGWVAQVYPDVETWWFDPKTQDALREFRHYVVRSSAVPLREWVELLNQLASKRKVGGQPEFVPTGRGIDPGAGLDPDDNKR